MQYLVHTGQRGAGGEYNMGTEWKALSTIIPTNSYDFMAWSERTWSGRKVMRLATLCKKQQ